MTEIKPVPSGVQAKVSDATKYLSFEVKFGPSFPVKSGASYKQLSDGIRQELAKHGGDSLGRAFLARTLKMLEFGVKQKGDAFLQKTFTGSLWCHVHGCHSCGDDYFYADCEAWGPHCESC
ncbi:MAG: hypothetical protein ACK5UQ_17645 [Planctomycetota bacterium]|jgi:hypothetical protein